MAKEKFDHAAIEQAAQEKWEQLKLHETDLSDSSREPYYLLFEFPYPSGDLHIGHWYAYAVTDIYARMKRAQGANVLFPIGFDSFGLPAENAAMKQGANPREWTEANMEKMRGQIRSIGASLDWSKEVVTSSPEYYKWTQWLFAKLYEQGLAERREAPVKWCPKDQTVLANEQVIDGRCERCDTEVEEKKLTQWFMKITAYAERLLADLAELPWREDIKEAQRAWIGKSEGAKLWFPVRGHEEKIEVFTTRPDTVFGATYVVLSPEHPLVAALPIDNKEEVAAYITAASKKTERERSENKEKTGVVLKGVSAINPATKEEIPIYVADYVLGSYGTGAVMAVPAHDERDYEFAMRHQLRLKEVVVPDAIDHNNPPQDGYPLVERRTVHSVVQRADGKILVLDWKKLGWSTLVMGGVDDGEDLISAAKREILEETGYKNLRFVKELGDMYAGYCAIHKGENRRAYATGLFFELENEEKEEVSAEEIEKHEGRWVTVEEAKKTVIGVEPPYYLQRISSEGWYYTGDGTLVHSDSFSGKNNREVFDEIVAAVGGEKTINYRIRDWLVSRQRYWGCPIPVVYDPDGKPHLVPAEHLPWLLPDDVDFTPTGKPPLASSKELHERVTRIFGEGWTPEYDTLDTFVDSSWYFLRYLDSKNEHDFSDQALMKKWLPVNRYSGGAEHTTMHLLYSRFFQKTLYDLALVPTAEPYAERFNRGIILGPDGQKMSKRWGNVVNPSEMLENYGSDAVRSYLAFIGPYNEPGHYPWKLDGVEAMRRFLDRIFNLQERVTEMEASEELLRALARASKKVGEDSERFKFNTALSALMVLLNEIGKEKKIPLVVWRNFLSLLAPFAPHLAEHLYEKTGGTESIHRVSWPVFAPELLVEDQVLVVVQVAGKKKGTIDLAPDATEEEALTAAKALPNVASISGLETPKKVIYVPGKIINILPS